MPALDKEFPSEGYTQWGLGYRLRVDPFDRRLATGPKWFDDPAALPNKSAAVLFLSLLLYGFLDGTVTCEDQEYKKSG